MHKGVVREVGYGGGVVRGVVVMLTSVSENPEQTLQQAQ